MRSIFVEFLDINDCIDGAVRCLCAGEFGALGRWLDPERHSLRHRKDLSCEVDLRRRDSGALEGRKAMVRAREIATVSFR
jgi:hypothetical protein